MIGEQKVSAHKRRTRAEVQELVAEFMSSGMRLIAQLRKNEKSEIIVATKAGRRLPRQTVEGYSRQNLTIWVSASLVCRCVGRSG